MRSHLALVRRREIPETLHLGAVADGLQDCERQGALFDPTPAPPRRWYARWRALSVAPLHSPSRLRPNPMHAPALRRHSPLVVVAGVVVPRLVVEEAVRALNLLRWRLTHGR